MNEVEPIVENIFKENKRLSPVERLYILLGVRLVEGVIDAIDRNTAAVQRLAEAVGGNCYVPEDYKKGGM